MSIFIAMIIASVILLILDPKFGAFVCLLAILSGMIQWRHQKGESITKASVSKNKSQPKKKSTRPHKKKQVRVNYYCHDICQLTSLPKRILGFMQYFLYFARIIKPMVFNQMYANCEIKILPISCLQSVGKVRNIYRARKRQSLLHTRLCTLKIGYCNQIDQ